MRLNDFIAPRLIGGTYYIRIDTKKLTFKQTKVVYDLKCDPYEAMDAMDSLIGLFNSVEEYEKACCVLLKSKKWI